jgi:site-specific DNA-methyltransferase (adenine-specific)
MEINKIHNIDCIAGMRKLKLLRIRPAIIMTSPPYNYGHPYIGYRDDKDHKDYLEWLDRVVEWMRAIIADTGSAFINIQPPPKNPEYIVDIIGIVNKHFEIQNIIHWIKSIHIEDKTHGRIRNITSSRYLNNEHEYVIHATTRPIHLNKESKQTRSNVWFIERANPNKHRSFPPKFPIELPKRCIELHGHHKDTLVLDPFMGLASTAIACKELGINYIGFEVDDLICEFAEERMKKRDEHNG